MRNKLMLYFGCVLIMGGALALGWYWHLQLNRWRVQHATNWLVPPARNDHRESPPNRTLPHAVVILPPHLGDAIGKIEIPRLSVSTVILEGSSSTILRVAAGHIKGTALPGTAGNVGIAAHRDTFFRALRDVLPGDSVVLTTSYGTFRYIVDSVEIVDPHDIQVLHATPDRELTLVTCYPFTYIGSAPKRFIVHARQTV
jgi:LPXTG-site transpeptidase (sortase) family protein